MRLRTHTIARQRNSNSVNKENSSSNNNASITKKKLKHTNLWGSASYVNKSQPQVHTATAATVVRSTSTTIIRSTPSQPISTSININNTNQNNKKSTNNIKPIKI